MSENDQYEQNGFGMDHDIAEVVATEESSKALLYVIAITIAISLAAIAINVSQAFYYSSDETISIVEMPKRSTNDSVVLARPIGMWNEKELTRHIKAFIRTYIRAQFPQSGDEVKQKSEMLVNMSSGSAYREFRPRHLLSDEFVRSIQLKGKETFYPDSMLDKVYIKKVSGFTDEWEVRVEGSMIKVLKGVEYRSKPVITYTIQKKNPTIRNPWGLTVTKVSVSTRGGK
ncbi:hypothetical protein [Bdellovibrio sp. BCCA]|uniref:hypothetical protein n=1 Tax=Bdellovibrio sp. BCCA TaxID=3136281 RepID=UPI0030F0AAEA